MFLYDEHSLPEESALLSLAEDSCYYVIRGDLLEFVVVQVYEVLEGSAFHPVEGFGGDSVEVSEVGLEAQVALVACAAVGADVFGFRLAVGFPVDQALVHGSSVFCVEGAPASGVAAGVVYDSKPLSGIGGVLEYKGSMLSGWLYLGWYLALLWWLSWFYRFVCGWVFVICL